MQTRKPLRLVTKKRKQTTHTQSNTTILLFRLEINNTRKIPKTGSIEINYFSQHD